MARLAGGGTVTWVTVDKAGDGTGVHVAVSDDVGVGKRVVGVAYVLVTGVWPLGVGVGGGGTGGVLGDSCVQTRADMGVRVGVGREAGVGVTVGQGVHVGLGAAVGKNGMGVIVGVEVGAGEGDGVNVGVSNTGTSTRTGPWRLLLPLTSMLSMV